MITDHKALTYFLSTPYHNARLMRWVLYLQEYDFSIEHCKGSDNVVADFFSRNFKEESLFSPENSFLVYHVVRTLRDTAAQGNSPDIRSIANLSMGGGILREFRNQGALQDADEMIRVSREKPSPALSFIVDSGITYVRSCRDNVWKLFVPMALVLTLLRSTHEMLGYAGNFKLHAYITRLFYWKNLRRDVKNLTRSCDICQRTKYLNYKMEGAYEFLGATKPNELVSVDFYGPLPTTVAGVQYIFVLQDVFPKFVTLYAIKWANTKTCLEKLQNRYFAEVGKPEKILSDNGTQFTSPIWRDTLESLGICVLHSSMRHPQSNPVERTMRELGRLFRTFCSHKHTGWANISRTRLSKLVNASEHKRRP